MSRETTWRLLEDITNYRKLEMEIALFMSSCENVTWFEFSELCVGLYKSRCFQNCYGKEDFALTMLETCTPAFKRKLEKGVITFFGNLMFKRSNSLILFQDEMLNFSCGSTIDQAIRKFIVIAIDHLLKKVNSGENTKSAIKN